MSVQLFTVLLTSLMMQSLCIQRIVLEIPLTKEILWWLLLLLILSNSLLLYRTKDSSCDITKERFFIKYKRTRIDKNPKARKRQRWMFCALCFSVQCFLDSFQADKTRKAAIQLSLLTTFDENKSSVFSTRTKAHRPWAETAAVVLLFRCAF